MLIFTFLFFFQVPHRRLAKFQNNSWKWEGMKKYIIEIQMRNRIYIFNGYGYHSFEQIIKEGLFFRFPDVFSWMLDAFLIDKYKRLTLQNVCGLKFRQR